MADLSAKMAARRKKLEEEGEDAYYFKSPDSGPRNKAPNKERNDLAKSQNGHIPNIDANSQISVSHEYPKPGNIINLATKSTSRGLAEKPVLELDDEGEVESMITQYQKQLREQDHVSKVSRISMITAHIFSSAINALLSALCTFSPHNSTSRDSL